MEKIDLKTRRVYKDRHYQGANELYGLEDLCKKYIKADMEILELGCWEGVSTSLFAYYAKKVHTVDCRDCPERINAYPNIEYHKGSFDRVLEDWDHESMDLVYIDGAHDYKSVVADINLVTPLIKRGGYIAGHDYPMNIGDFSKNAGPGVDRAIRDTLLIEKPVVQVRGGPPQTLQYKPIEFEVFGDSSWVIEIDAVRG